MACAIASAAIAPTTDTPPATAPVATEKMMSPSPMVWTGTMARANPSWAIIATRLACAFSSRAFVATTPMVLCVA